MSERFVEAFLVAPGKLAALAGTPAVGFATIRKALGKKPIFEDMVMTLGDGDDDSGLALVEQGLDALATGKKPETSYPERLTQLVLHAHGEPLKPAIMECNFMPADEGGSWAPAFRALGMKAIAKQWAKPTLAFPGKRSTKGWGWPVMTLVEPAALATWAAELGSSWRKQLATLPSSTFDPDADDDAEDAYLSREEVAAGISTLAKWVATARKPSASKRKAIAKSNNALVLVLDGDQ